MCSPSSAHVVWARPCRMGGLQQSKVVLQLRIRPESYGVGQETVGASSSIDPHVSNDSIEWYTKGDEKGSICITGVLFKLVS